MDERPDLVEIASAVVDQTDLDWARLERNVSDEARSILRQLRVVADISRAMESVPAHDDKAPLVVRTVEDQESIGQWGHLRLLAEISRGTFGVVYRAWDMRLDCQVALKLANPDSVSRRILDPSLSLREARLLARVHHHNVVTVHGADRFDNRFGLWMELVNGHTLQEVLDMHGPFSASEAAQIGIDICHALAAVHGAGLLHRDIKATNVMREGGGRIVLMDFGAGEPFSTADHPIVGIVGTPLYLAPELFKGDQPSRASDIYSLGVLLYHLVTNSYPVEAVSVGEIADAHQGQSRRLLRDVRPDLTPAFIDVVERSLSVRPTDRYATAGAFGDALAATTGIRPAADGPAPVRVIVFRLLAAAAVGAILVAIAMRPDRKGNSPSQTPSALSSQAGPRTSAVARAALNAPAAYEVEAAFYTLRKDQRVRLGNGASVALGDKLFLNLAVSQPAYVYLINQDDRDKAFLLFPLPGQQLTNPVPFGAHQLPGPRDADEYYWEVTSAGNREHFLLYVSPERLADFEALLGALPRAEAGRPVNAAPLPPDLGGTLRSVGGLAAGERPASGPLPWFSGLRELPEARESASGVWARQITFDNPAK